METQLEIHQHTIAHLLTVLANTHSRLGRANNRHMVALREQLGRDLGGIQQKHAAAVATGRVDVIETFLPMTHEQQ
jgi:hypothetical protein